MSQTFNKLLGWSSWVTKGLFFVLSIIESMSLSNHWLNAPEVDEATKTQTANKRISRGVNVEEGETAMPARVQAIIKNPKRTLAAI